MRFEKTQSLNRRFSELLVILLFANLPSFLESHAQANVEVTSSGAYHTNIAIEVPQFHNIEPQLYLTYDSNIGDGPIGRGWRLSGTSELQRVSPGKGAPRYDASDIYVLDGMELVRCKPGMKSPSCMHPPSGRNFTAYAFLTDTFQRVAYDNRDANWHVWNKNGIKAIYTARSKSKTRIPHWRLSTVEDTSGNLVRYTYTSFDGDGGFLPEVYLHKISYNGTNVTFYYDVRPDGLTYATNGLQTLQKRRLKSIDVTVGTARARAYALEYDPNTTPLAGLHSRLVGVRQHGDDAIVDAAGNVSGSSLPTIRMTYTPAPENPWSPHVKNVGQQVESGPPPVSLYPNVKVSGVRIAGRLPKIVTGDFNGDSRTDWLAVGFTGSRGEGVAEIEIKAVLTGPFTPAYVNTTQSITADTYVEDDRIAIYAWALDMNGDGRTDLLIGLGYGYQEGPFPAKVAFVPALSLGNGTFAIGTAIRTDIIKEPPITEPPACRAGDFDGNGLMDIACSYIPEINQDLKASESFLFMALSRGDGTLVTSNSKLPFHDNGGLRPFAVDDIDRDGRSDLLFADIRGTDLDMLLVDPVNTELRYDLVTGVSHGGEASTFSYSRQETPWTYVRKLPDSPTRNDELTAADVDGDGRSDFVLFQYGGNKKEGPIAILTGRQKGDGTLILNKQPLPEDFTKSETIITMGDANGDGLADLLVASKRDQGTGSNCVNHSAFADLVLNRVPSNGDGTFALPATWDDCKIARQVDLAWNRVLGAQELRAVDTNGDGLSDFLLAGNSLDDNTAAILRDDVSASTGLDTFRWVPAEINGDGRRDYIYVQPLGNQSRVHTLIAQPDGGFVQQSEHLNPDLYGVGRQVARGWKVMDVNGDGRTDLVYVHCAGMSAAATCLVQVQVIFSTGNGQWKQASPQTFTWPGALADASLLIPADVNGDGKSDLVSLMNARRPAGLENTMRVQVLIAGGDFRFPFALGTQQGPFRIAWDDSVTWRPLDINGDGKTDFIHLKHDGAWLQLTALIAGDNGRWDLAWSAIPQTPLEGWNGISPSNTSQWRSADLNGDGKSDLVHFALTASGLRIHTLLSGGRGTSWMQRSQDVAVPSNELHQLADTVAWLATDLDRDGRTDFVHPHYTELGIRLDTLHSTSDGLFAVESTTVTDPGTAGNRVSPIWQVTDRNGDGQGDIVRIDLLPENGDGMRPFQVSSLASTRSNALLSSITTGMGGITELTYVSSAVYNPSAPDYGCFLPVGATIQVVATATIRDGRSNHEIRHFAYGCPTWSYYHRIFLGWTEVLTTTEAIVNRPAITNVKHYDQTDACLTRLAGNAYRDAFGLNVGTREIIAYYPSGQVAPYRCLMGYRHRVEFGSSAMGLNTFTYFNYDEVGNVTSIIDHGSTAVTGDETTATYTYKYAYKPWIVGLPWQQTVADLAKPNVLLRSTFFCYDGKNGTQSANCPGTPTRGLLTGVQRVDDLGLYVTHTYEYDKYRNIWVAKNSLHFGTTAFFDSTYHVFPTAAVNALGHSSNLEWDTAIGTLKKVTDANGTIVETQYDVFGRPILTTFPRRSGIRRQFHYWGDPAKQYIHEYADDGTKEGLWVDTYLDGLGRAYQIVKKGDAPDTAFMQLRTYSDASDRVYTRTGWFKSGTTSTKLDTFDYDNVGRLLKVSHADGTTQRIAYDANASGTIKRLTNERGNTKTIEIDGHGGIASVMQLDKATGQIATIRYSYNAVGELLTITDANGNVTTNTWDMLGHLRRVQSPDLGVRTNTYDLTGNVKTKTDTQRRTIEYTYDGINRLKTKTYPNGAVITWNYDEPGHGTSKGRLTSTTDLSVGTCAQGHSSSFNYDESGTVATQVKCIDGMSQSMSLGHDGLGRLYQITYADGEVVTYKYDSAGRVESMPGYVDHIAYDAEGHPKDIDYANDTHSHFTYDQHRSWQDSVRIVDNAGLVLYDAIYSHEPNGLVKSSSSTTNAMNLTFTHDDMDRLREVSGDIHQTFSYDPSGNITYNSNVHNYSYPAKGPSGCIGYGRPQPCNAPIGVGSLGTLLHDVNGNLSMITNGQNQQKSIDWNDDHQPWVLSDFNGVVSRFSYDAHGERVSHERGEMYARYFSRFAEHSNTAGLIKNYYVGSLLVARKAGGSTRWLHSDQIGSTRLVTDTMGAIERYDYMPFGEQSSTSGSSLNNPIRFSGQVTDDSGLIYMHARYYDPQLARFLSPDTIVANPLDTQSVNPYSYALNSPVSYSDPTGRQPEGISQRWLPDSSAFSIRVTIENVPPPIARQPGQICSVCLGSNITSTTALPSVASVPQLAANTTQSLSAQAAPTSQLSHNDKVVDLIMQYRGASGSGYEAWDRAREDYRLINLKGGDPVLQQAEHFLFRYWLASTTTLGEYKWIPRPSPAGKGVGQLEEDPWYKFPVNSLFMMNFHDFYYNKLRPFIERLPLVNITPTTPAMQEWDDRGYDYGFCAAGRCGFRQELQQNPIIYDYDPAILW